MSFWHWNDSIVLLGASIDDILVMSVSVVYDVLRRLRSQMFLTLDSMRKQTSLNLGSGLTIQRSTPIHVHALYRYMYMYMCIETYIDLGMPFRDLENI